MSQVTNEGVNLAVAMETTLGEQPTSGWVSLQPNDKGDIGSSIKKVARTPVSQNRQNQKSIIVDLDAAAPWTADVTKDLLDNFLSGIFMSAVKHSGGTGQALFRPTAVTATGYTITGGLGALAANILLYGRGFPTAANNGLKLQVGSIAAELKASGLTAESLAATSNATVEVAGVQGALGDLGMDASGNITSTALNFTLLGLQVGQWIWVGGGTLAAPGLLGFVNTAYRGFARIRIIAAGKLTLERRTWTVGAASLAAANSTQTVQIFFSRWCRNVPLNHADALKPSYHFELAYPDLGGPGIYEYEYVEGCLVDEFKFNMPLTDKATADLSFIGMDAPDPTLTRATGGATALAPLTQVAVSTATDLLRLRIANTDETGLTTDFKNVTVTFKNGVTPEKILGTLGATRMNLGRFECMVDADVVFTSSDVVKAIRDNRTITMDFAMRNGDFAALIDVMSASLDEGDRNFPTNASVTLKTKSSGFQDEWLGSTAGMSIFPYCPAT